MSADEPRKQVVVCQNTACRKFGAKSVLAIFQQLAPADVQVESRRCLGQCGNGPMVIILPEQIWYDRVHPDEVPTIVEQHLRQDQPVKGLLYRKFHPRQSS